MLAYVISVFFSFPGFFLFWILEIYLLLLMKTFCLFGGDNGSDNKSIEFEKAAATEFIEYRLSACLFLFKMFFH